MREIKFRVWIINCNKMQYSHDPDYHMDDFSLLERFFCVYSTDKTELMQYTGLKDKNGKEIYEGDIIFIPDVEFELITDHDGIYNKIHNFSEVIFYNGGFKFKIEKFCSIKDGIYSYEDLKDETDIEEIEIIGNIYENPKLLEKINE